MVLDQGQKSYLINSFAEIGWPDPFPTPQVIGNMKENFNVSADKIASYIKSAKDLNRDLLVDDAIFLTQEMPFDDLNILEDPGVDEQKIDLVY